MLHKSSVAAALLALSALAFVPPASAAIVNYDFSVAITSGPLASQTFSGSFSFDDEKLMPGISGEDLYELKSFEFDFDGKTYTLADLAYGDAAFSGGAFIGLDAGNATFTFLPAIAPLLPAFLYEIAAGPGDGNVVFNRVPEPASGLLLAAAFGAMLRHRRRRPPTGH
jgi:hypothetical protein